MGVYTHSMAFMCIQWVFRGCSILTQGIHVHSMGVQGLLPLTQWHLFPLNGVQGVFTTHSLAFTRTHKHSGGVQYWPKGIHAHSQVFRGCSILTQRCSCTLTSIQGVFNTVSKAFMHTHKHSVVVQYWLKGVHAHSQAFRGCSVLTQMRSFSWSHHGELHSIMTQWHPCAPNGCLHSLNGIHVYSMFVQGVFNTDKRHSCALYGCSGAAPIHSLFVGIHAHSQVFRGCSIHVEPVCVPEGQMNVFPHLQSAQRPYKLALNFCWITFLWLCQARRHDVTLDYMIGRWSWCPPIRLATKNKKVLQKIGKLDILQEFFN